MNEQTIIAVVAMGGAALTMARVCGIAIREPVP